jgi:hypothetical protein
MSRRTWTAVRKPRTALDAMPQIILSDEENSNGDHTHTVGDVSRLDKWDNNISSIIILSRTRAFFDNQDSRREHDNGAGSR